ncbi:MAG: hypothetical protein Kow00104_04410 [Rhodothalassiaceae bacterium]
MRISFAALILVPLLGACAVSIGDQDYGDFRSHAGADDLVDGERRVTIEEVHGYRDDAARAMAVEIDRLRAADCRIDRADGWRRLGDHDHEDPRGFRIIATCPAS